MCSAFSHTLEKSFNRKHFLISRKEVVLAQYFPYSLNKKIYILPSLHGKINNFQSILIKQNILYR